MDRGQFLICLPPTPAKCCTCSHSPSHPPLARIAPTKQGPKRHQLCRTASTPATPLTYACLLTPAYTPMHPITPTKQGPNRHQLRSPVHAPGAEDHGKGCIGVQVSIADHACRAAHGDSGQVRLGQGRGQWTQQSTAGQGRAGQGRAGQSRAGQLLCQPHSATCWCATYEMLRNRTHQTVCEWT